MSPTKQDTAHVIKQIAGMVCHQIYHAKALRLLVRFEGYRAASFRWKPVSCSRDLTTVNYYNQLAKNSDRTKAENLRTKMKDTAKRMDELLYLILLRLPAALLHSSESSLAGGWLCTIPDSRSVAITCNLQCHHDRKFCLIKDEFGQRNKKLDKNLKFLICYTKVVLFTVSKRTAYLCHTVVYK